MIIWIVNHEVFGYDNYSYVNNALSLSRLSPEPFGYELTRPPFIPFILSIFSKFFYSPDNSLEFMQLSQSICSLATVALLTLTAKLIFDNKDSTFTKCFLLWCAVGNCLVLSTGILNFTDLWAAVFGITSFLCYYTFRESKPQRALWGMGMFWLLATISRYNYFPLGIIFVLEETFRYRKQDRPYNWKTFTSVFIVIPVIFLSIYAAPYVVKYRGDFFNKITQAYFDMQKINHAAGRSGFVYHQLLYFALPIGSLLLSFVGCWKILIGKNYFLMRLLLCYTGLFLITHLILTPMQYVRFISPFLLPYLFGIKYGLKHISTSRGKNFERNVVIVLFTASLLPLFGLTQFFSDPLFDKDPMKVISNTLNKGKRILWYGPSFPFYLKEKENQDYWPHPIGIKFHYVNYTLREQTGRHSTYIPFNKTSDTHSGILNIQWALFLQDGDHLYHNANNSINYYSPKPDNSQFISIYTFGKKSFPLFSLDNKNIQQLLKDHPEALVIKHISDSEGYVMKPSTQPTWSHIKITDKKKWTSKIISEKVNADMIKKCEIIYVVKKIRARHKINGVFCDEP